MCVGLHCVLWCGAGGRVVVMECVVWEGGVCVCGQGKGGGE